MEDNKKFSLSDFFEPDANLEVMKFKQEGWCNAVLIIENMNELNLIHILLTGVGRYYLAMRLNGWATESSKFKDSIKSLLDAEFNNIDNQYFNDTK